MALTNGSLADGLGGQELVALISGFSVSTSDLAKAVASMLRDNQGEKARQSR